MARRCAACTVYFPAWPSWSRRRFRWRTLRRNSCRRSSWHYAVRNDREQDGLGRPEMMPIIGLFVGAAVGLWLGHNFDALLGGGFIGLIAGLLINAWQKRSAPPAPPVVDGNALRV